MSDLDAVHRTLDDAITGYLREAGRGNEIVTGWLVVAVATASDIEDGDSGVLVATAENQSYITNLGLAEHASRYFGPGEDE